ncbi:MAG: hypothetical protein P8Y36_14725, partial [Alphaproteobacteria bacterium]
FFISMPTAVILSGDSATVCATVAAPVASAPTVPTTTLFVVRLDAARQAVVVGPREAIKAHRVILHGVNWLGSGSLAGFRRRLD